MLSCLFVFLFLYFIPYVIGHGVNRILKKPHYLARNFFMGNVFLWACFQVVTVPMVLMRANFMYVVLIIDMLAIAACIWVLYDEIVKCESRHLTVSYWQHKFTGIKITDLVALGVFFVMLAWLLYKIITLQHTDADDSRFVVNAADILRTYRMYLTDLTRGTTLSQWYGELAKDVISPWAVYIAYYAKMTGTSAVTMAHSILPVSLILNGICVYWMIANELFGVTRRSRRRKEEAPVDRKIVDRCIFMCVVLLVNIYGCVSVYTAETFMLTRIWQGKAVVASVAIPAMFLFCMWLYQGDKNYRNYILVLMLNIGMCLMSGMGIIAGAVMLGCVGIVYGITKKQIKVSLKIWLMCVPNVIYIVLKLLQ